MKYIYWYEGEMHRTDLVPEHRPYVDIRFQDPVARYGYWLEDAQWIPVPLEDFPKDFQLALLFLGTDE